ncbi:hypothetical protein H8B15_01395 [Hymenobacter sp. BT507]|uniref:Glycosyltransferase RgtA/B/C/D-like domain-containing protein n=1 Tax=Hymenobacter citatus TaxID=2763506 RepID=A0ABR7MES9_9BACT|nr:hypothetical protein [Hymenobacter citatus]MBC6609555.1 hypothetical protein [Hymenobacter citatus]
MRILLALILNTGLLWLLWRWVRREQRAPGVGKLVLPILTLKLAITLVTVALLTEDARYFQYWGVALTDQLWTAPIAWVGTLLGDEFHAADRQLIYHGYSNTFFLIKVLSALNLASLGNVWLNALYLSVFCLVGCWQLVRRFPHIFPDAPVLAVPIAFLLWPTVLYWTSGLTKESLLVSTLAWLTALVLDWLYEGRPVRAWSVVGAVVLVIVAFKMRYFFAVLLFAALLGLALIRVGEQLGVRRRGVQVALVMLLLSGGSWVLSEVNSIFRFNRFSSQLLRNYYGMLEQSRHKPHIEYAHLAPTWQSVLSNAPAAAMHTVLRPWLWESTQWNYLAVSIENVLLLVLLLTAAVAVVRGRGGRLPFALVLVLAIYCLGLAILLGLTTPNLGTLSRYRTVLLPFLLLLLLQNNYVAHWLKRWC